MAQSAPGPAKQSSRDVAIIIASLVALVIAIVVIARMVHNSQPHVSRQIQLPPGTVANGKVAWIRAQRAKGAQPEPEVQVGPQGVTTQNGH